MDGWIVGWMDGWIDRQIDRRIDRQIDRQIDRWIDRQIGQDRIGYKIRLDYIEQNKNKNKNKTKKKNKIGIEQNRIDIYILQHYMNYMCIKNMIYVL